jgi:hypothetical protein
MNGTENAKDKSTTWNNRNVNSGFKSPLSDTLLRFS